MIYLHQPITGFITKTSQLFSGRVTIRRVGAPGGTENRMLCVPVLSLLVNIFFKFISRGCPKSRHCWSAWAEKQS